MWLIVSSNDHAPLTVRPIYSSSLLKTAQMMIFSLVEIIRLEKSCITSAYLQWLCHSGEQAVARGPLVIICFVKKKNKKNLHHLHKETSTVSGLKPIPAKEKWCYMMMPGFCQYMAEYTVANFCCYPIRRCVTYMYIHTCTNMCIWMTLYFILFISFRSNKHVFNELPRKR